MKPGECGGGPFDYSKADDLIADLTSGTSCEIAAKLRAAMEPVLEGCERLSDGDAQRAVAASVIVAIRVGAGTSNGRIARLLEARSFDVCADLRSRAYRTLNRIATRGDNEWFERWEAKGGLVTALETLSPFRAVLSPDEDRYPDPIVMR